MKRFMLTFLFVGQLTFGIEPFSLPWMNHEQPGTSFKTSDYPDGIFVIHPYFIYCQINYQLEPKVNQLANDYVSEPRVHVLDIGVDKKDSDYEKWIEQVKPNHPVLKDSERTVVHALGITHYPTTIILDGSGSIHYRSTPGIWTDKEEQKIRATIDWLLQKP